MADPHMGAESPPQLCSSPLPIRLACSRTDTHFSRATSPAQVQVPASSPVRAARRSPSVKSGVPSASHSSKPRASPASHSLKPRASPASHSLKPRASPASHSSKPRASPAQREPSAQSPSIINSPELDQTLRNADADCDHIIDGINHILQDHCPQISQSDASNPNREDRFEDDPLWVEPQKLLLKYYYLAGVYGLMMAIKRIALDRDKSEHQASKSRKRKRQTVHDSDSETDEDDDEDEQPSATCRKSWSTLIKDIELGADSRTLFYLSTLPPESIPHLIQGDLPRAMQDPGFKARVGPSLKLRQNQGTYAIFVAARDPQSSTQGDPDMLPNVGRSLTVRELIKVVDAIQMYISLDDEGSTACARQIDSMMHGSHNLDIDYTFQRRYGAGEERDGFDKYQEWIDVVEEHILQYARVLEGTAHDHLLDLHLQRCLTYVGLSWKVKERATQHWSQPRSESRLFALFVATVNFVCGDNYEVDAYTYQILRTVRTEDIGLDETITSVLLSSFYWDGGLNWTWAGNSKGKPSNFEDPAYQTALKQSQVSATKSTFIADNIESAARRIEDSTHPLAGGRDLVWVTKEVQQEINELLELKAEADKMKEITRYRKGLEMLERMKQPG